MSVTAGPVLGLIVFNVALGRGSPPPDFSGNLERLLLLLDPAEATERGEILRELGRMDEALASLCRAPDQERWAADQIGHLAAAGDRLVRVLTLPAEASPGDHGDAPLVWDL